MPTTDSLAERSPQVGESGPRRVLDHLNEPMQSFIARQEMMWLSTCDSSGACDCTFRGGPRGFVRILGERRLAWPEYRGSDVHAAIGNIRGNGHASLLFLDLLATSVGLHVRGRARVLDHAELLKDNAIADEQWASISSTIVGFAERWVILDVEEAYDQSAMHVPLFARLDNDPARKTPDLFGLRATASPAGGAPAIASPVVETSLFRGCSEDDLRALTAIASEVTFAKGEVLIREGDAPTRFIVLLDGRAEVKKGRRVVKELEYGDFVGEIGIISRSPASATVTALVRTRALAVEMTAFRRLVRQAPTIAAKVSEVLAARTAPDQSAGAEVVRGLALRLGVPSLIARFPPRLVWAAFMFLNGFMTIGLLTLLAMVSHTPFVFPSLGATAFLFFFSPTTPSATPRNAISGHACGIVGGYIALLGTGLQHAAVATPMSITVARVVAAALSLAIAGALMILFQVPHPPAGATALIVALGIVSKPPLLLVIELAVILLSVQAIVLNRLARLDYPIWARRRAAA